MASWVGIPSSSSLTSSTVVINSTNTTVDIIPRIFRNVLPISGGATTALSNEDGSITTVFTTPTVEVGVYQVTVGFEIENDNTVVAWSNSESMTLYIAGSGSSVYPLLSLQPAYVNNFVAGNDVIYQTITGLVTQITAGPLNANIIRNGTPTTNKQAQVYLFTAQKVA